PTTASSATCSPSHHNWPTPSNNARAESPLPDPRPEPATTIQAVDAAEQALSAGRLKLVLGAVGLAGLSFAVMQSLVIPVLPHIRHDLGSSTGAVTWLLTGNLLSSAIATPILGRVGDLKGKKRVLVGTLSVLALGTVLAALAQTLPI